MALFNASSNLWDNVASLEELKNFTCILKVLSFSAMSFLKKKRKKRKRKRKKAQHNKSLGLLLFNHIEGQECRVKRG